VAPLEIDPSEKTLLRGSRTTLCQLKSGECNKLKNYQVKIGAANNDIRTACRGATDTSKHLFNCMSSPTDLRFLELWKKPREASSFLRTLPSFAHLAPSRPLPTSTSRASSCSSGRPGLDVSWQTNQPTNGDDDDDDDTKGAESFQHE
jgi:hypothetical protein